MSKIICSAAIQGAHKIVSMAEVKCDEALEKWGPNQNIGFPNTTYYLPVIYAMLGTAVETLGNAREVLNKCKTLLPPIVKDESWLPSLDSALEAGMSTLFAEEILEAIKYLEKPDCYTKTEDPLIDNIWLGAADDVIMRKRGVEFVDGSAPGFAIILGAAPTTEIAVKIAIELQEKNLYVLMCADHDGKTMSEQLIEAGVQIGWSTRLVSFGQSYTAAVFAVGFAVRAAMSFGGIKPGDFDGNLLFCRGGIFAFIITLGAITEEWVANAAGAINWGVPIIADAPAPKLVVPEICDYELITGDISHDQIVQKAIDVRGLKIKISKIDIPMSYGPAFEGERIRKEDLYFECGGGKTLGVELTVSKDMSEVEDGKIEIIGSDIDEVKEGGSLPFGILIEVAGRQMQPDFEPILERQIHHLVNYIQGVMHIGQRSIMWLRIGKAAAAKGFSLKHLGKVIHAKYHQEFSNIVDKVQVTIYTKEEKVRELLESAKNVYVQRDKRVEGMVDETEEIFYSCTLCQSFAPSHVCIITPERTGMCGAYNWLDCKVSNEINPTGPNQPIAKGECFDPVKGQWKKINDFVSKASGRKVEKVNAYSLLEFPMTACGCFECVATILPMCNGVMVVNRDFMGMTPSGMKFTTLAGLAGGGNQTPGFLGISKHYICSRKFIKSEGGLKRVVWLPKMLKEEISGLIKPICEDIGIPDFLDMIADETVGITEEEILPFLQGKGHPALAMEALI